MAWSLPARSADILEDMLTGVSDLDDVDAISAVDTDGALPAAARAGAQVRAIAEAVREGVLDSLATLRPRAVVFVCQDGPAWRAAQFVIAAYGRRIDVPLMCAPVLPGWVGPLDVVVACGDDPGDRGLADAVSRAGIRRSAVVVDCPLYGPVRDVVGGDVIDFSPRVPAPRQFRFAGYVAALVAVLSSLTSVRLAGAATDLDQVADHLDNEASRNSPASETFHNAAKTLAMRLEPRRIIWAGDGPEAVAVATEASAVTATAAGIASTALSVSEAVESVVSLLARIPAMTSEQVLFHDPQFDGPTPSTAPRVLVVTAMERQWSVLQQVSAIPDVHLVTVDSDFSESGQPRQGDTSVFGDVVPEMLTLTARIHMAAVYARIVGAVSCD